ncbi:hypothetical protein GC096_18990 [Paenibacillus sp. LMG 31461]|uniref:GerA spore germination protein n=1 Tax=Paenibacillus plantarum TaxID=2654975 RepID=A0ABX1XCE4_9BACL|nr:spore germination protein [Paenibacillus plantarum]NOU66127.1 hypothetical protein [Paenibacillus plantarum]
MQSMLEEIKARLFQTEDLIVRNFDVEGEPAMLMYLETLCDPSKIEISLFKQWFRVKSHEYGGLPLNELLTAVNINTCLRSDEVVKALLSGKALVCVLAAKEVWYALDAQQSNVRSIHEPENERSIVGERAGFVEHLNVNLNLIRIRASSAQLKVHYILLGKQSNHKVAILWEEGVAEKGIVEETIRRVAALKTNMEVHPGRLQRQLEEKSTIFPQVYSSERVDMTTNLIMQGRVAILCDQSSTCLIVPVSFYTFLRSIDSILLGSNVALVLQSLRAIGVFLSLYICSLYIAIVSFHHELLPSQMAISIKSSLENVPYPPIVEAILMIVIFQLIAEATIRLPSQIAQMVGVTGGIIISESLVKIGFVSNVFIVIVALSVIGSFLIPTYQMRIFVLIVQLLFVFGAWVLGFYGIMLLTAALLIHFFALEPFGVPYCMPIRSKAK